MLQPDPASLVNLHDIISAPQAAWWPPAPGWFMLAAAFLTGVIAGLWRWLMWWRSNAYRRVALAQLAHLEVQLQDAGQREASLRILPELVKRTALAVWPRQTVASLSDEAWLVWLDETWQEQLFSAGPGRLLPLLAYADASRLSALTAEEIGALVSLIRNWIRLHRRSQNSGRGGRHA
jgi:hypothetical protein